MLTACNSVTANVHLIENSASYHSLNDFKKTLAASELNNKYGYAINYAAYYGRKDLVGYLLETGVDVNQPGLFNYTPLCQAVIQNNEEMVKYLLEKGASTNPESCSPLLETMNKENLRILTMLIDYGVDINKKDLFGMTPLHNAIIKSNYNTAKLLMEKGASISIQNKEGLTALQLAQKSGNTFISSLFLPALNRPFTNAQAESNAAASIPPSDVDFPPMVRTKADSKALALVIGIENYRQHLPRADHAVNDANSMARYLVNVFGYLEENVIVLTNQNATKSDFEKYIERWLVNNVEKGSSIFIYYSGHGAPNPRNSDAYLVPYDGDPAFIEETGYSLKRLYANLEKLPATKVVVAFDACFSGAGGKSVVAKGSRALVRTEKVSAKNMVVMTASGDQQISSTYNDKAHGVFTYFLLKGIKQILDEDRLSRIEVEELFNYLKPKVLSTSRKLYNNEQTPQLLISNDKLKQLTLR